MILFLSPFGSQAVQIHTYEAHVENILRGQTPRCPNGDRVEKLESTRSGQNDPVYRSETQNPNQVITKTNQTTEKKLVYT